MRTAQLPVAFLRRVECGVHKHFGLPSLIVSACAAIIHTEPVFFALPWQLLLDRKSR
jgi:hypothetical protein